MTPKQMCIFWGIALAFQLITLVALGIKIFRHSKGERK